MVILSQRASGVLTDNQPGRDFVQWGVVLPVTLINWLNVAALDFEDRLAGGLGQPDVTRALREFEPATYPGHALDGVCCGDEESE